MRVLCVDLIAISMVHFRFIVAKFWLSKCWRIGCGRFCSHEDGGGAVPPLPCSFYGNNQYIVISKIPT